MLLSACVIDPVISEIIRENNFDSDWNSETLQIIADWAQEEITHTHSLPIFNKNPGKDPWGSISDRPIYKKLLPSEMRAMSKFSNNKYTGKCSSITHLLYGILRNVGMSSDQCVILRIKGHTIALLKIDDTYYLIDNNEINKLTGSAILKVTYYECHGFYNESFSFKGKFRLNKSVFSSNQSLIESVFNNVSIDRRKSIALKANNKLKAYAMQSLLVEKPNLYKKASMRGPHVNKIAEEFKDLKSIINWIEKNIVDGHVLSGEKTIQLADQTIVFRTGNYSDIGLLTQSILAINGIKCELLITSNNAYMDFETYIYSIKDRLRVSEIVHNTLFRLR